MYSVIIIVSVLMFFLSMLVGFHQEKEEEDVNKVSAKQVFDMLTWDSAGPDFYSESLCELAKFKFDEDEATAMRRCARHLSLYTNMPFAFYSNASGGMNSGFFLYRAESFACIDAWIDEQDWRVTPENNAFCDVAEDVTMTLKTIFRIMKRIDPKEEYKYYKF